MAITVPHASLRRGGRGRQPVGVGQDRSPRARGAHAELRPAVRRVHRARGRPHRQDSARDLAVRPHRR